MIAPGPGSLSLVSSSDETSEQLVAVELLGVGGTQLWNSPQLQAQVEGPLKDPTLLVCAGLEESGPATHSVDSSPGVRNLGRGVDGWLVVRVEEGQLTVPTYSC